MRLPRMTTRRWMVAVLVVGLVLGIVAIVRRQILFRQLAVYHDRMAQRYRPAPGGGSVYDPLAHPRLGEYHEDLARISHPKI